jgi:hypothetical protein
LLVAGCVYDEDDRCGPNQHLEDKDRLCVCDDGFSFTAKGCVEGGMSTAPKACASDADCTDTGAATYCELVVSRTCLIPNCSASPNDCPTGMECCPFSTTPGFDTLPNLCLAAGLCTLL